MAENKFTVSGDQYREIDRKMREIKRQLDQKGGSPLDPDAVSCRLQEIIQPDLANQASVVGEYRVAVEYCLPGGLPQLEAEFSKSCVSPAILKEKWEPHPSLEGVVRTPGEKIMKIVKVRIRLSTDGVISELRKQGLRPADHLEAYAFSKAFPRVQSVNRIYALGSSAVVGFHDHRCVMYSARAVAYLGFEEGEQKLEDRIVPFVKRTFRVCEVEAHWCLYEHFLGVKLAT